MPSFQNATEATQFSGTWHFQICLPAPLSSCLFKIASIQKDLKCLFLEEKCLKLEKKGNDEITSSGDQIGARDFIPLYVRNIFTHERM